MSNAPHSRYTKNSPEVIEAFSRYKDGTITYAEYKSVQRKIYKRKKKEIEDYGHILPEWQVKYTTLPNFRKLCRRNVPESVYAYHEERYARHFQRMREKKKHDLMKYGRVNAGIHKKYLCFLYSNHLARNQEREDLLWKLSHGLRPYILEYISKIDKQDEIRCEEIQKRRWRQANFIRETASMARQNNKLEMMRLAVFADIEKKTQELKEVC